jgi:Kef-type K+ transport system membrane component KefB
MVFERRGHYLGDAMIDGRSTTAALVPWLLPLAALATIGATPAGEHTAGAVPLLFGLALLVLAAKAGGLVVARAGVPPVLGELLVGIGLANVVPAIAGGSGIAFVRGNPTLAVLAELGVLLLLFDVGLETDLRALARVGATALLVALTGIVAPIALGWAVSAWLVPGGGTLTHLFVGATLAATSVGITARVLKDLGAAGRVEGRIVLGAAVVDDVLGLVLLAVLSGAAASGGGISGADVGATLVRAVAFLVVTIGFGALGGSRLLVRAAARTGEPFMIVVIGLGLCFSLAYAAEMVGLAGIVGAFAAGLVLDPWGEDVRSPADTETLRALLAPLAALFVPLFFVLMGVQVEAESLLAGDTLVLGGVLTVAAFAGKLACGIAVTRADADRLAVGFGMLPRGEVGLIFAGVGAAITVDGQPLLPQSVFSAIVLTVLVTTLAAPIGLRWRLAPARAQTAEDGGVSA